MENDQKTILIVDDFKDTREMYGYFLNSRGFRTVLAGDGEEGLTKAAQLQPDIVIMDLSLPVISGWEATRRLKNDDATKHIPIIILTAYAMDGAAVVVKTGCEGFLVKPCLPEDMLTEVVRVLNSKRNAAARLASDPVHAGK
jgi:two-component system, cell cycle response regulator DivK